MSIFQKSVINKYLKSLDKSKVNLAYKRFHKFYGNKARLANIMQLKEENYQEGFLREIFVQTLGYTINPDENYNLTTEYKNQEDSRKADGAILKNGKAIGVIELKSTKTKDLESIKEQAFGYKINQPDCKYVITSNFQNLRFYIDNATEYEEFDLFALAVDSKTDEIPHRFMVFYLLLSKENIFNDLPEKLKQETKFHEQQITNKLYKDYKNFKDRIFETLVEGNPQYDKLTLFKKSQKLLDRFLFVFFAEDSGLIPPNATSQIIEQWKIFSENDEYFPLYNRFQKLFRHLDEGHTYKKWGEIPAYNGGLFRKDEILDSPDLKIPDGLLQNHTSILSAYDFGSEVDVNILGHIFEHSLIEIEEIKAELSASSGHAPLKKTVSKRKKDGIFYTPKYITKYIVENTVGILCNEKKEELQMKNILIDETYQLKSGKLSQKGKQLYETLHKYKDWLLTLKILDPACGSGAFLNQTLDFLIAEHKQIDDLIAELTGDLMRIFDTDKSILENNIYGVDINEESVEIAKLSLWLRTAQRGRTLSDLSGNIKCGNSLIDDPEIAGEKAFDWNKEFPHIFNPKIKEKVYQNLPDSKPDYVKLVKEKSKEAQEKAEQAAKLSKELQEVAKKVYEYAEKIDIANEPVITYGIKKCGFDVVLGNPPWGALLSKGEKQFFRSNSFNDTSLNTAFLFIEKGLQLLKENSHLSFIIPKGLAYVPNLESIRSYLHSNFQIEMLIDTSESFKQSGVELEAIIIGIKKSKPVKKTMITGYVENNIFSVSKIANYSVLKNKVWGVWLNKSNASIIDKISQKSVLLGSICQSKRGININKYVTVEKNDFIVLGGKTISRYSVDFFTYSSSEHIQKRFNWQLQKKIILQEIVGRYGKPLFGNFRRVMLNATIDQKGELYTLDTVVNLFDFDEKYNMKYILAILNSRLLSWYFHVYQKSFSQLTIHSGNENSRNLPVYPAELSAQQFFIEKADLMLSLNKEFQTEKSNFLKTLQEEMGIKKITKKLDAFYEAEYDTFKKELVKQKVKISLGDENNEWREYFNTIKHKINTLQIQINKTDSEIDKMVYKLYELTADEIAIIEKNT